MCPSPTEKEEEEERNRLRGSHVLQVANDRKLGYSQDKTQACAGSAAGKEHEVTGVLGRQGSTWSPILGLTYIPKRPGGD